MGTDVIASGFSHLSENMNNYRRLDSVWRQLALFSTTPTAADFVTHYVLVVRFTVHRLSDLGNESPANNLNNRSIFTCNFEDIANVFLEIIRDSALHLLPRTLVPYGYDVSLR